MSSIPFSDNESVLTNPELILGFRVSSDLDKIFNPDIVKDLFEAYLKKENLPLIEESIKRY